MKKLVIPKLNYKSKRRLNGFLFVLPWVIGFIFFFLIPLITTIVFSFNTVGVGVHGGRVLTFTWFKNYYDLFFVDLASDNKTQMLRMITQEFVTIVTNMPLIVLFSLFAAMLLNLKFKGRGVVRLIFFLPIILGLNIVVTLLSASTGGNFIDAKTQGMAFLHADLLKSLLLNSGLPAGFIGFVSSSVTRIFQIMSQSGVQILIFLAGLQSINQSLYEVAAIEGANKYEEFWRITLPMVSSLMLFVAIYTIVDMFLSSTLTTQIYYFSFLDNQIGVGAALSIVYLLFVLIVVGIVWGLLSLVVYKND